MELHLFQLYVETFKDFSFSSRVINVFSQLAITGQGIIEFSTSLLRRGLFKAAIINCKHYTTIRLISYEPQIIYNQLRFYKSTNRIAFKHSYLSIKMGTVKKSTTA